MYIHSPTAAGFLHTRPKYAPPTSSLPQALRRPAASLPPIPKTNPKRRNEKEREGKAKGKGQLNVAASRGGGKAVGNGNEINLYLMNYGFTKYPFGQP